MAKKQKMRPITAIRTYFNDGVHPDITMAELKELTKEERAELGAMCAKELGVELEEVK
jgi:hypothetical protein